ncbi:acyl-protein thioesterase, partial [Phytophthora pseudosyringae]
MVVDKQNTVEYNSEEPSAVVFFLHGLGDTAHGWADSFRSVAKDMPHVKFVLPTAAPRPVTIANGREIPAWYDIEAFVGGAGYAAGIEDTRDALESMIAKEVKHSVALRGLTTGGDEVLLSSHEQVDAGIPRSRIVVGGFSQGGAVSYFTGFQTKQPIGGIMVLSSFIPREK